jgi:hypothetical protein
MAYFTQSPVLWPEFHRRDYIIWCSRCLLRLPIWPNPWVFMHYTCKFMWLDNYIILLQLTLQCIQHWELYSDFHAYKAHGQHTLHISLLCKKSETFMTQMLKPSTDFIWFSFSTQNFNFVCLFVCVCQCKINTRLEHSHDTRQQVQHLL